MPRSASQEPFRRRRSSPKYGPSYTVEFLDPDVNLTVAVRPERAFGLLHDDFTGSPTRWTFGA